MEAAGGGSLRAEFPALLTPALSSQSSLQQPREVIASKMQVGVAEAGGNYNGGVWGLASASQKASKTQRDHSPQET